MIVGVGVYQCPNHKQFAYILSTKIIKRKLTLRIINERYSLKMSIVIVNTFQIPIVLHSNNFSFSG